MTALQIISQAQAILARHLPPDGITQDQCINELLALLDGCDAVLLTQEPNNIETAIASYEEAMEFLKREFNEKPLRKASGIAPSAGRCQRLEAALDSAMERERQLSERLANNETTIKQAAESILDLNQRLRTAIETRRMYAVAQRDALEQLSASQERERQLSERLASIAALSTGS